MAAKKANNEQLKSEHEGKLIELYNTYYKKCLDGDTASLKAFLDCSKELFADSEENELLRMVQNAQIGE